MSKTIRVVFVSGGPGRKPIAWRVSRHPRIAGSYAFAPGVPTSVTEDDALLLLDPVNTGGRVFELAEMLPAPAPASTANATGIPWTTPATGRPTGQPASGKGSGAVKPDDKPEGDSTPPQAPD